MGREETPPPRRHAVTARHHAATPPQVGHVLGFGHPDELSRNNLAASCTLNNATCRDPFGCAHAQPYNVFTDASIMHSFTRRQPQT